MTQQDTKAEACFMSLNFEVRAERMSHVKLVDTFVRTLSQKFNAKIVTDFLNVAIPYLYHIT